MVDAYQQTLKNLNLKGVKECKILCPMTEQEFKLKILEYGLFEDFMKKAKSWGENDLVERKKNL